jgi:malate permease and related proteins
MQGGIQIAASPAAVAGFKVLGMSLVLATGWAARRRGIFTPDVIRALSWLLVDLAFPSLAFVQMMRIADLGALHQGLVDMLLCLILMVIASATGYAAAAASGAGASRPTVSFLTAIPNWVFIPLPIATALWGAAGAAAILWMNATAQIYLWTVGLWTLRGGWRSVVSLPRILINPGVLATAAGLAVGLALPAVKPWLEPGFAPHSALAYVGGAALQAADMVGLQTIPLSFLVIGAQLADTMGARPTWNRPLCMVLSGRLVVAPVVTGLLFVALLRGGAVSPGVPISAALLVAAMPVAVSCGMFVERFGGDRDLGARAVLLSTLGSLLTVPAFLWLFRALVAAGAP